MTADFVHLHVHSEYSMLDGLSPVESIVRTEAERGAPAVAITDHGNMSMTIQLVRFCKKYGINPIIGMEGYFSVSVDPDATPQQKKNYHKLILARNNTGYHNLMKLSSLANLNLYERKPRFDLDMLAKHASGLIVTTSCLSGIVNRHLLQGDRQGALQWASDLKDILDPGSFFVEVQNHGIKDQLKILGDQVWLSKQLGVPLLATNDSHFTDPGDEHTHEALLCMGTGTTLDNPNRFKFDGKGHWIRSAAEMYEALPHEDFPDACSNTLLVAEMIEDDIIDLSGKNYFIPKFEVPAGFSSSIDYLRHITFKGAEERYGNDDGVIPQRVRDQLEHELRVIDKMGFPDYFLILSDIIAYVHSRGGITGPGRGSAAGCCVSYCTGITLLDPLHHGLKFERFLNEGRMSMPDIDVDFDSDGRIFAVEYAKARYGHDSVALINTFGTLKPRAAIRSSVKVSGGTMDDENMLATLFPGGPPPFSLRTALKKKRSDIDESIQSKWNSDTLKELRHHHSKPGFASEALDLALSVEGVIRNQGIHAAAVLLTPGPLTDYFPVRVSDKDDTWVCQFDKDDTEAIGGLKYDFLGLINLTLINIAVGLIESDMGRRVDINRLPLDDRAVYDLLSRGETDGVFQVASEGMTELVQRLQPTEFSHIAALTALYRPGPMANDVHNEFARRKNGQSKVAYFHPDAKNVLSETFGLVVYQEQIMELAQTFAGYSAVEADNFRKAMGKKDADVMAAQHDRFISGVSETGYTEKIAQQLWDLIEPFSGYAFNKSHSVAYGMLTYQTAWLKTNYPAQYAAACIDILPKERVPRQVEASRRQGIQVYSPDINRSGFRSVTSKDSVWLGMSGIAQSGYGTIDTICRERARFGNYKSLQDFLKRTAPEGINQRLAINLVHAGAFDSLHGSRKLMAEAVPTMIEDAKKVANDESQFDDDEDSFLFDLDDELETVLDQYVLDGEDYTPETRSAMELESIGFFTGAHPFIEYEKKVPKAKLNGLIPKLAVPPSDPSIEPGLRGVHIYGVITEIEHKKKRDKIRTHFMLESGHGSSIKGIIFGQHVSKGSLGKLVCVKASIRAAFENSNETHADGESADEVIQSSSNARDLSSMEMSCERVDVIDMNRIDSSPSMKLVHSDDKVVDLQERRNRSGRGRRNAQEESRPVEDVSEEQTTPVSVADESPVVDIENGDVNDVQGGDDQNDDGQAPDAYRFYVDDMEDVQMISSELMALHGGNQYVIIRMNDEDTLIPKPFDLRPDTVEKIASSLGVRYESLARG